MRLCDERIRGELPSSRETLCVIYLILIHLEMPSFQPSNRWRFDRTTHKVYRRARKGLVRGSTCTTCNIDTKWNLVDSPAFFTNCPSLYLARTARKHMQKCAHQHKQLVYPCRNSGWPGRLGRNSQDVPGTSPAGN